MLLGFTDKTSARDLIRKLIQPDLIRSVKLGNRNEKESMATVYAIPECR